MSIRRAAALALCATIMAGCTKPSPEKRCEAGDGEVLVFAPTLTVGLDVMTAAGRVMDHRLQALGYQDATVCPGAGAISVAFEKPLAAGQRTEVTEVLSGNVRIEFRPVVAELAAGTAAWRASPPKDCAIPPATDSKQPATACAKQRDDGGAELPPDRWNKLQLGPAAITSLHLKGATASRSATAPGPNDWSVTLDMTEAGARIFAEFTGRIACEHAPVRRRIAIIVDGVVVNQPQLSEEVSCGEGIQGGKAVMTTDTEREAARLSATLSRALPVGFLLATSGSGE